MRRCENALVFLSTGLLMAYRLRCYDVAIRKVSEKTGLEE